MTNDEITEFLDDLEKESKALKEEAIKLCWFMRGGLSYDESMYLSFDERNIIAKLIKDNLETTKKSGQPFF